MNSQCQITPIQGEFGRMDVRAESLQHFAEVHAHLAK